MAKKVFEFDTRDFDRYFKLISKAAHGEFKKQIALWFEASGFEFLRVVQDEIIRRKVVDTRLLLTSFEKGKKGNVWKVSDGGLTLEVGTNIEYAQLVNDGHLTVNEGTEGAFRLKDGTLARWVPGKWKEDKFEYIKGAKTGMLLKQKWVEGAHYWEAAIRIFERIFKTSVEKKMAEWRDKYFK